MTDLAVTIDFGNDTTKISYAYTNKDKLRVGKLINTDSILSFNFPSIARFDTETNEWYFSDLVKKNYNGSSITVVKIKSLMSLLIKHLDTVDDAETVFNRNKDYFYNKKLFSKYYFPAPLVKDNDFENLVKNDHIFKANKTPREVCVKFFEHIAKNVYAEIKKLEDEHNDKYNVKIGIIYPISAGKLYAKELETIIGEAFKKQVSYKVDSTRGICSMAYVNKLISSGDNVLVFEIGDEMLSVVRTSVKVNNGKPTIMVEGREGHKEPEKIGGNDIDNLIAESLKEKVRERKLFGTNLSNDEELSVGKQFVLAENIKKTKMLISSKDENFIAPITIPSDVMIKEHYSAQNLMEVCGITKGSGVAKKFLDYIEDELKFVANRNVNKIIISGGGIETLGLFDYLKEEIENKYKGIEVAMIDIDLSDEMYENVTKSDDSTYAASIGASIAEVLSYEISTVMSLSYATCMNYDRKSEDKYLAFYVEKGTNIKNGELVKGMYRFYLHGGKAVFVNCGTKMPIYSINITKEEIDNDYLSNVLLYKIREKKDGTKEKVLDISDRYMEAVKFKLGLTLVAGSEDSTGYVFKKNGVKVTDKSYLFGIKEYIAVSEDGRIYPGLELDSVKCKTTYSTTDVSTSGYTVEYLGVLPFEVD